MLKRYHRTVGVGFRILDVCVIGAVWLLSFWLRFTYPLIEVTKGFPSFETYAALTPFVMILWSTVFTISGVYGADRILRRTHEAQEILKAHAMALLAFLALTYFFSEYRYSRGVMIYFAVLGAVGLVVTRLVVRNAIRRYRRGAGQGRRVIIIGEGGALPTLTARVSQFPELGVRIIGAVVAPTSGASEVAGIPIIGRYADIANLIEKHGVSELLIALERREGEALDRILSELKDEAIDIQIIPDLHEYLTLGCAVEDFDGVPIVNLNDSPLSGWRSGLKRLTDLGCSFLALVLLSPLLLVIAVLIKLSSRGPVIYRQERMGLDGRTFQMLKFRSMKPDAETSTGAVWARPDDDRRTWIGKILRSTSLDELPQLWNILKGEMSLVGPRPERPVFVSQFRTEIPHYMLRHKVKAGLTGWAQIHGLRGNTSLEQRIHFDLYYIRNWSYFMDLKIMIKTIWKGFIHKNAY